MTLQNAFEDLATEATLASVDSHVDGLEASAGSIDGKLPALSGGKVPVTGPLTDSELRATAVPVSATSLPLPSGAATAANQSTANSSLSSIDGKTPALVSGRVPVDVGTSINVGEVEIKNDTGSPVPVSGTVTANAGTNLNTSALALEAGGNLAGIRTDLGTDGTTPPTLPGGSTGVRGWLRYVASLLPAQVSGRWPVDGSGVTQPISAASLPLPSGAATSAAQTTGNTSLASIDGKLPALSGGGRVLVDGSGVTQPVSGTVTATGPLTDTQLRATAVPVSGPLTDTQLRATAVPVSAASLPLPSGAATSAAQTTGNTSLANLDADLGAQADAVATSDTGTFSLIALVKRGLQNWTTLLGRVPSLTVTSTRLLVDGSGVTQPVSGPLTDTQLRATAVPVSAASLPLPSGAASAAKQPALGTAGTPSADVLTVQGAASGTALPVSAASLPLPSGASTSALQTTGNTSLSSIDGKLPALMSGSVPVLVQNTQVEIQNDTGNPIPVGPAAMLSLSGSGSALNADLVSVDCSAYRGVNFQITGTWSGTLSFQVSNDNTTWYNIALSSSNATSASVTASNANIICHGATNGYNYFRIRLTAYTSGTAFVTGFLIREVITPVFPPSFIYPSATSSLLAQTVYTVNSAASTNAATIKASAGNLYHFTAMNASAATKYVRFFNKASNPTMGTDVPIAVVAIPATSSKEMNWIIPIRFSTGIAVAITGGAAATDSTNVAAGDVQLLVSYA